MKLQLQFHCGVLLAPMETSSLVTKEQSLPDLPMKFFPWTYHSNLNGTLFFSDTSENNNGERFEKTIYTVLENNFNSYV